MKTPFVSDFESLAAERCAPLAGSAFFASERRTSHPSATLLLRIQQSSPPHEQIRQRGTDFEPVQVLRESAVTHLLEAEDPLDHPNRVLDLRAHPRLAAVPRLDDLVDPSTVPVALVGEVPRSRCRLAHRLLLAAIRLIAPHTRLFPIQQVRP